MKDIIIIIADPETGEVTMTIQTATPEITRALLEAALQQLNNNLN